MGFIGQVSLKKTATLLSLGALGGGNPYDAVLNYATLQGYTKPSAAVQDLQRTLVATLVTSGIWSLLDLFYCPLGDGDINFAKINWKAPSAFPLSGVYPYTPNVGFTVNVSTTGGMDTAWVPSVRVDVNTKYQLNNASVGSAMGGPASIPGTSSILGTSGTAPRTYFSFFSGGFWAINSNGVGFAQVIDNGIYMCSRISVTQLTAYKNDSNLGTKNDSSTALPTSSIGFIKPLDNSISTGKVLQMGFVGGSMAGKEIAFYGAWQAYSSVIRAGVIYAGILSYATSQGFTLPSVGNRTQQQKFITDLIAAGIWDEMDLFYNFVTDGDFNFAKINWKAPGTFQPVNVGVPVFAPNFGFTSAVPNYLNTNFIPSVNGTKINLNSAGIYGDTVRSGRRQVTAGYSYISNQNTTQATVINGTTANTTISSPYGFLHGYTNLVGVYHYANGVLVESILPSAPTSITDGPLWIGGLSGNAEGFGAVGVNRCFGIGGPLTGKEVLFFNAWNNYDAPIRSKALYQAIINYATSQGFALPSIAKRTAGEKLIYDLIVARIWDALDVFYNFFTDGDSNFAKINWKNPGTLQAVGTGHDPVFAINTGFTFDGATQYLSTGYIPSTAGNNQYLSSGSYFGEFDVSGVVNSSPFGAIAVANANGAYITQNNANDLVRLNGAQVVAGVFVSAERAFLMVNRDSSVSSPGIRVTKNNTAPVFFASATTALVDLQINIGCLNSAGSPGNFNAGTTLFFGSGGTLNGKGLALYTAWNAYKSS